MYFLVNLHIFGQADPAEHGWFALHLRLAVISHAVLAPGNSLQFRPGRFAAT